MSSTGNTYNIIGNNNEKRIYKIDVRGISDEDIQSFIKEIENKFKKPIYQPIQMYWDYQKWEDPKYVKSPYTQQDWNQTLLTTINQCSAKINQMTLLHGANRIAVNKKLFNGTIKTFEYTNYLNYDEVYDVSGRYLVKLSNTLPLDKVYVYHEEPDEKVDVLTSTDKIIAEITIKNFL